MAGWCICAAVDAPQSMVVAERRGGALERQIPANAAFVRLRVLGPA